MQSRLRIAGVDKPVSVFALGSAWFAMGTRDEHWDLLDRFVGAGGTTVDTGRLYGDSEAVIGGWMAERRNRDDMVVITKGGLSRTDTTVLSDDIARDLDQDVPTSLDALGTDVIDLYLLHRDNPAVPVGRFVDALNAQLGKGRIRAFGGSNWELQRVQEAQAYAAEHGLVGFAAVSNNLSLAEPTGPYYAGLVSADAEARRWHAETGTPLVSWSSGARGFFTGRFRPDVRDNPDMVRVYYTDANFERLHRAEQLGQRKGGYWAAQVALAWLVHQPLPVIPVIGPRTPDELDSSVAALEIELTDAELRWLNLEEGA